MMNAAIPIDYLFIGAVVLLFFFWKPRIAFALLQVAFFLLLYLIALPALYHWPDVEATWEAHILGSLAIPLGLAVVSGVIFAAVAYFIDRDYDRTPQDDFKGGNLFFRYGRRVFETVIPISLEEGVKEEDAESLLERFREFLWNAIHDQFEGLKEVSLEQEHTVRDLGWNKEDSYHYRHGEKTFLKATFRTARKSTLYYFIYLNLVGRQLLVHHYVYIRGRHFWYHALVFIVSAPAHVWLWGYSWVKGRYSILGRLNRYHDKSSYDLIDLKSYFGSACFGMIMATKRFAKVYGLLTEELEKVIFNNLHNLQNTDIRDNYSVFTVGSVNRSGRER
ncbi:MAG: hypothetical protein KDD01_00090 [Phaeodactylibacter sp.]|nr:hypothetical protein [Phaeodactylibacter sp.]